MSLPRRSVRSRKKPGFLKEEIVEKIENNVSDHIGNSNKNINKHSSSTKLDESKLPIIQDRNSEVNEYQKFKGFYEIKKEPLNISEDENDIVIKEELDLDKATGRKTRIYRKNKICKESDYKNPFVYSNIDTTKNICNKTRNTNNKSSKWTCMTCLKVCSDKESLINHYKLHKILKDQALEIIKDNNDYFKCNICCKEFTSSKSYEKHNDRFHGNKGYACEFCNKSYKNMLLLCIHNYSVHDKREIYKCLSCDFETEIRYDLKQHLLTHQEGPKYKCEICGKCFSSSIWFEEHKNFHNGAMPFECEICLKSFPYTRYLVAHKKSLHPEAYSDSPITNECPICSKRFPHKKSLMLHIQSHTGENSVLCEMCGKRLSSSEHLKQHIRIHTGYKPYCCPVCGKGFAKKCNLTLHERVHTGEKPNICRTCGKGFSQRSTLVIHERYHSGERPYICHLCQKGFVAKGLLGVHLKSCTKYL